MPNSSSISSPHRRFSKLSCCLLILLFSFSAKAQTLTGLWIGAVSQDSTTVRKDQSFEIVLTEYKGKVYGYSRSEFIVDEVLYYIVKRVEGTIEGDLCEVTDDEIVACNFPKRPEKGVKVTSIFRRNGADGQWYLDGTWKTNRTKNYYSLTGKVSLAEEKDLTASKIFPHLEELKIAEQVAFYKERKEGLPIVKIVPPERADMLAYVNPGFSQSAQRSSERNVEAPAAVSIIPTSETTSTVNDPVAPSLRGVVARNETTAGNEKTARDFSQSAQRSSERNVEAPAAVSTIPTSETTSPVNGPVAPSLRGVVARNETTAGNENSQEPYVDEMNVDLSKLRKTQSAPTPPPAAVKPVEQKQLTKGVAQTSVSQPIVVSPIPKVITAPHERDFAAMDINERRTEVTQVVEFSAVTDSIQIALYDNGQIDGDTVSVLMNGEVILSKQGLKATPIRHTIYLSPGVQEFNIVLYAENLGTLPPNTGLVVVRDGKDVYNLRFSSDYSKNTGIVFRRKK